MEFDLTLNFFVLGGRRRAAPTAARGPRRDGARLPLDPRHATTRPRSRRARARRASRATSTSGSRPESEMTIPSRLDPPARSRSTTRRRGRAVERYINTIRKDAPNCEGGNNIDYIVRYNGLARPRGALRVGARDGAVERVHRLLPGAAVHVPARPALRGRRRRSTTRPAPGRRRARVGIGGPCWAIYPVESAGGYQLFGRTIPIYDLAAAQRGVPREPDAAAGRRPVAVPPRRGGRAARACSRTCTPTATATAIEEGALRRRGVSRRDSRDRRRGGGAAAPPRASGRRRRRFPEEDERAEQSSSRFSKAGIQATVQDYPGRPGMLAQGFFPAGPMDHFALRAANLLAGNAASAAALEVTLGDFALRFDADATVAVCGAEAELAIDGEPAALWESHRVAARDGAAARRLPGAGLPHVRRAIRRAGSTSGRPRLAGDVHDGRSRRLRGTGAAPGDRLPLGAEPSGDGAAGRRFRPERATAVRSRVGDRGDARPAGRRRTT